MLRVRTGIILILVSWLPIAQILIFAAHSNNQLQSEAAAQKLRLLVWAIQIVIGLVGVWLVGKPALAIAKQSGWRATPNKIWHLFWANSDN